MAFNFSNAQQVIFKQVNESTKRIKGKITWYITSMVDIKKIGDRVMFSKPSNANNSLVYIEQFIAFSVATFVNKSRRMWHRRS